jgi:hypothetical protein
MVTWNKTISPFCFDFERGWKLNFVVCVLMCTQYRVLLEQLIFILAAKRKKKYLLIRDSKLYRRTYISSSLDLILSQQVQFMTSKPTDQITAWNRILKTYIVIYVFFNIILSSMFLSPKSSPSFSCPKWNICHITQAFCMLCQSQGLGWVTRYWWWVM